jgi:hypothetical protein
MAEVWYKSNADIAQVAMCAFGPDSARHAASDLRMFYSFLDLTLVGQHGRQQSRVEESASLIAFRHL